MSSGPASTLVSYQLVLGYLPVIAWSHLQVAIRLACNQLSIAVTWFRTQVDARLTGPWYPIVSEVYVHVSLCHLTVPGCLAVVTCSHIQVDTRLRG